MKTRTTKLTEEQTQKMQQKYGSQTRSQSVSQLNRKQAQEALETHPATALDAKAIRRMTTQQIKEELLALQPMDAEDSKPAETEPAPATETKAETTAPAETPAKAMPQCTCGCGGTTKGGRFLPGHDARYHAAQKRAAGLMAPRREPKAKAEAAPKAERRITGNHFVDTAMGLVRKLDDDGIRLLLAEIAVLQAERDKADAEPEQEQEQAA